VLGRRSVLAAFAASACTTSAVIALPKVLINRPISNRQGCCTSSQNSGGGIKLGEVVMILDLHRQGLTVSAIACEPGHDRQMT
jgi:hypothetical protein